MGRNALKPPIEPLSEAGWRRVEERVFEQLQQPARVEAPSRRPRLAMTLAVAALLTSAFALLRSAAPTADDATAPIAASSPQSTHDRGSATKPGNAEGTPPGSAPGAPTGQRATDAESAGQRITTGSELTTAKLGDAEVTIAAHSDVSVRGGESEGWLVEVEQGSIHCHVAPRAGRPDFVVRAGDSLVRVVGTKFDVTRRAGEVSVAVQEGRVSLEQHGSTILLVAGQTWPPSPTLDEPTSEASLDERDPGERDPHVARTAETLSTRQQFELAASLETSQPGRALHIYADLSRSGGAWAANALFAQARLLVERGRHAEGRRLLQIYLDRYPQGPNATDARSLLKHGD